MSQDTIYTLKINRSSHLGGGFWDLKNLTPITVIFGKNGSGKSILLRKIRDIDPESHHYCVPERGGNIILEPSITLQEASGKLRVQSSSQNLGYDYRSRVISRIGAYLTKRGASRDQINVDDLNQIETCRKY